MEEIKEILETIRTKKASGEKVEEEIFKESVTIRKSDLEKLGRDLMKEVDEFLHDEYMLTYSNIKSDQEKFDKLTKYQTKNLSIRNIFDILTRIKLDDELHGDLYYKKESYLDLFKVLVSSHSYL